MTSFNSETKIWSGHIKTHPYGNASLGEVVLRKLSETPEKLCQIHSDAGTELTNREMKLLSIRAAQNLSKLGLLQGDVVGFVAKNSEHLIPTVIGCFLNGYPISPMEPSLEGSEIAQLVKQNEPKVVFCDYDCLDKTLEAFETMAVKPKIFIMIEKVDGFPFVGEIFAGTGTEMDFVAPDLGNNEENIFALLSSSGTTGLPKGVKLSHAIAILFGTTSNFWPLYDDNVILWFTNIFWVGGVLHLLYALLNSQTFIITIKPHAPENLVAYVEKHRPTNIFSAVIYSQRLLKSEVVKTADLSSIRTFMISSNPISRESIAELQSYLKNGSVLYVYGMTELCHIVAANNGSSDWASVGQLCPNLQVKIADDDQKFLGSNEKGELYIKLPYKILGYNNDQANKDAFHDNGWFKTGDIGYFDDEGNLFLVERKKEIIRYNYWHIYPTEIEQVIQMLRGVQEVAVVGIPDLSFFEVPAAVIVKSIGSDLKEKDVLEIVKDSLVDYKQLRGGVYFVKEELPKTTTGKVKRRLVKAIAERLFNDKHKVTEL